MAAKTHKSVPRSDGHDLGPLKDTRRVSRVLARVGDKWSVLVIALLRAGPHRFNGMRRGIEGISQQMLTRTLRALERDGVVSRVISPASPPQVVYALTALGQSLSQPVLALGRWACEHIDEIDDAQRRFDARTALADGDAAAAGRSVEASDPTPG
ncbi:transcriptional regulator [Burkholderia sp. WAC0059]|uniref:winged helix-turn-helix transcriptional regulator n=1 Tax=Burkholderia sp. WAC0059 TaxID=2066022 RepID=UPI000C7F0F7D|nr:helix-turn-helix domain-containing protein [Burkholderia sp. WAC0059]PLZ02987.1 transcriptional regulator [Burkholderia sp. WAC0059]